MKHSIFLLLFITKITASQPVSSIDLDKEYYITLNKDSDLNYLLKLEKNQPYKVSVLQQGVDVVLTLTDKLNNKLLEKDSYNGAYGWERLQYSPDKTDDFLLHINRLEDDDNPDSGRITVKIKKMSKVAFIAEKLFSKLMNLQLANF